MGAIANLEDETLGYEVLDDTRNKAPWSANIDLVRIFITYREASTCGRRSRYAPGRSWKYTHEDKRKMEVCEYLVR